MAKRRNKIKKVIKKTREIKPKNRVKFKKIKPKRRIISFVKTKHKTPVTKLHKKLISIKNKKLKSTTNISLLAEPIQVQPAEKIIEKAESPKNKNQFFIFLLLIFVIIGAASFIFKNIYLYGLSVLIIIYLLIVLFKKKKQPIIENTIPVKQLPLIQSKKIYLTEFDKFYNYILENKNITISKIAHVFRMPKKQAEVWARILEDRGLIKLYYPLVGEPELRCPE